VTKVGMPGAPTACTRKPDHAELLKPLGYATGQFGKNTWRPGRAPADDARLDEFFGNLYT